jgi:hypothetical protein
VGALLLAEIVGSRPPKPPPEWHLLLDLALDADDRTRQTACGFGYMEDCTQASRRTIYGWLAKLNEAGMIRTVSHSRSGGRGGAKGLRAVYEIQVPNRLTARISEHLNSRSATGIRCDAGALD